MSNIEKIYQLRFSDAELTRHRLIWRVLCSQFFTKFISSKDFVLDIACGNGNFINNIECKRKMAIDINSNVTFFLNSNVEFFVLDAINLKTLKLSGVDKVFISNFLEHLKNKDELESLLDQVIQVLKENGQLLIMGPNLRYLGGKYWDFYDHDLPLTHLSLCEVLMSKGFEIDFCFDKFLPYTTKSRIPSRPFLIDLYLKVPLLWKLLGKQFFIVARKPKVS